MGQISFKERQRINHELKKVGFGGLDDPNTILQIATLYRTHDSFRGLLMSTAPDQRRIAYEALRPHLCFAAKPLDVYEMEIKQRAEREQWDVWNPNTHMPRPFEVGEIQTDEYRLQRLASEAIEQTAYEKAGGTLEMVCRKCTIATFFPGATRKEAIKKAHDAGWRWDERNGVTRQYCPDHVPGRASMTLRCAAEGADGEICSHTQQLRVWDEQDGYAKARVLGWEIADVAKCPRCAVKLVTLQ